MNDENYPNRWIFIPRKNLQEGHATYRCTCICCLQEWNAILQDSFEGYLTCPLCNNNCGKKNFEVDIDDRGNRDEKDSFS